MLTRDFFPTANIVSQVNPKLKKACYTEEQLKQRSRTFSRKLLNKTTCVSDV